MHFVNILHMIAIGEPQRVFNLLKPKYMQDPKRSGNKYNLSWISFSDVNKVEQGLEQNYLQWSSQI